MTDGRPTDAKNQLRDPFSRAWGFSSTPTPRPRLELSGLRTAVRVALFSFLWPFYTSLFI
jgi:hypothetical protein